jgi:inosine-uridine nucleoside N-ribohydrolase
VELPPAQAAVQDEAGPIGLRNLLAAHPGATVVTLGPLTNLAISLNLYPEIASHIGRLVAMGGAMETGNVTRFAEFNFYADPEAVQFVLDSGVFFELLPWDAVLEHEFHPEALDALGLEPSRAADLFFRLQDFVLDRSEHVHGRRLARHPDPLAMAYALEPSVATRVVRTGLTMELGSTTLRGASVRTDGQQVTAAMSIDRESYAGTLRRIATL